ncbi:MAG: site-2 protease family protein [Agitococcus sp.]|nr:site-2 protease family protein [Agitococcus sp.]
MFMLALFLLISPIFFHEVGHWVLLHRYRVPVTQFWFGLGPVVLKWGKLHIGMLPIGGAVVPESARYAELTPSQRMNVALAGPLASAIYGLALLLACQLYGPRAGGVGLALLAYINFWLAVFNLLPLPPLDGFHVLVAWHERKGTPFPAWLLSMAHRLGSGFMYGLGFYVLFSVFWPGMPI